MITYSGLTIDIIDLYQLFGMDNGTPTKFETYKFTGKPYSIATGLPYYRDRWNDLSLRAFTGPDSKPSEVSWRSSRLRM